MKYQHTCHRIATVHQRGGTFQNLYRVHVLRVYLDAVLIAPLLSFLAYALVHHDDAVVAQSADNGF